MLETIKCIGLIFFNATKLLFKKCGFTLVPQDELNFNMGEKKQTNWFIYKHEDSA